jgi:hypothetical protein
MERRRLMTVVVAGGRLDKGPKPPLVPPLFPGGLARRLSRIARPTEERLRLGRNSLFIL